MLFSASCRRADQRNAYNPKDIFLDFCNTEITDFRFFFRFSAPTTKIDFKQHHSHGTLAKKQVTFLCLGCFLMKHQHFIIPYTFHPHHSNDSYIALICAFSKLLSPYRTLLHKTEKICTRFLFYGILRLPSHNVL